MTDALRVAAHDAMHVLTADDRILVGDEAVIHVFEGVGYPIVAALRVPPFRWITPWLYDRVANNRRKLAPWFFTRE